MSERGKRQDLVLKAFNKVLNSLLMTQKKKMFEKCLPACHTASDNIIFCQIIHVKLPFLHPVAHLGHAMLPNSLRDCWYCLYCKKSFVLILAETATSTAVTQIALDMLTARWDGKQCHVTFAQQGAHHTIILAKRPASRYGRL